MHLAGIESAGSYEWNFDSNLTHNLNFGSNTAEINIRELELSDLPKPGSIDIVVGSPPCTQFSFANRGGGGNIEEGLIDLHKFLSIVTHLKPKFWAMENVPRVSGIISSLVNEHPEFKKFRHLITVNTVVDCSEYGAPQRRKRMICGDFPIENLIRLRNRFRSNTLGEVVQSLKSDLPFDPLYGWKIEKVTDHELEQPLNDEELRLNREAKRNHPIYNKMPFPEPMDRASRTVTSLCTRVSRESMVILDDGDYRRLTLRERAMCMGFPVSYTFYGRNYSSKLKMIGNAIPPPLTFCIFSAMKGVIPRSLSGEAGYVHSLPTQPPPTTPPPYPKNKFPKNRSFRLCVPHLRFGSGVRFELSNKDSEWKVRFYGGSSKSIYEIDLDACLGQKATFLLGTEFPIPLSEITNKSSAELQEGWIAKSDVSVFTVLDSLGHTAKRYLEKFSNVEIEPHALDELLGIDPNKSMREDPIKVLVGLALGSSFNSRIKAKASSTVVQV